MSFFPQEGEKKMKEEQEAVLKAANAEKDSGDSQPSEDDEDLDDEESEELLPSSDVRIHLPRCFTINYIKFFFFLLI